MTNHTDLSLDRCKERQKRVAACLAELNLESGLFVSHENIQYLTAFRPHRLMSAAVLLLPDGTLILSAPNQEPDRFVADMVVTFDAQWHCTLRQTQAGNALESLSDRIPKSGMIGIENSQCGGLMSVLLGDDRLVDMDEVIWQQRRHKDPDELEMIRKAISCTEAMYASAREIIQPGITELEVYCELHKAAVLRAGEPLTALGNDFQCNSPGGPPRNRPAEDGELFVLDLGPCYRGYYADNCRSIAVNGNPTDAQHQAWEAIVSVLDMVEDSVRPGVRCRDVFHAAQDKLDQFLPGGFPHHLGHGFGLFPHEAPHLNPNWDDVFEVGDCFTAEPGLYAEELRAGIRLEQNYVVSEGGVERLTDFPLDL